MYTYCVCMCIHEYTCLLKTETGIECSPQLFSCTSFFWGTIFHWNWILLVWLVWLSVTDPRDPSVSASPVQELQTVNTCLAFPLAPGLQLWPSCLDSKHFTKSFLHPLFFLFSVKIKFSYANILLLNHIYIYILIWQFFNLSNV